VSAVIPVLLSVAFGAGVALLYEALTNPRPADAGPRRLRGLEEFLTRAGLHDVSPRDFLGFALASGLVVGVCAQLLLGWGVVSVLAGTLGLVAPVAYYVRRHDRRRAAVQAALVEAIGQLRDAIRTGLSVPEALVALAQSGPETLHDRLGGRNVSQVLDRLAQATRAEQRVQQELRAYQARNVLSARIVAAVPLVVLIAIRQVNPGYLALFNDWWGQVLLAGCVASVALGYAGMLWLTRLPGEERVLRP
jgi:tight adherence protein B